VIRALRNLVRRFKAEIRAQAEPSPPSAGLPSANATAVEREGWADGDGEEFTPAACFRTRDQAERLKAVLEEKEIPAEIATGGFRPGFQVYVPELYHDPAVEELQDLFPPAPDLPPDEECPTCGLRAADALSEDDEWRWHCMACGQNWRPGRKRYD
jgi:hypothetical protein